MHTRGCSWAQCACHHQNYVVLPGGAYCVGQALVQAALPKWRHDRVPARESATPSGKANWKDVGCADGRSLPRVRGHDYSRMSKLRRFVKTQVVATRMGLLQCAVECRAL